MKKKINQYISKWKSQGYSEGIPDEAPSRLEQLNKVPSYKNICRAIMRNDFHLTTLGFSKVSCEAYSAIKKIEIEARNERT